MQFATTVRRCLALAWRAASRPRFALLAGKWPIPCPLVSRHDLRDSLAIGVQGVAQEMGDHVPPLVTADRKWHGSESLVHKTAIVCTVEDVSRTFLS